MRELRHRIVKKFPKVTQLPHAKPELDPVSKTLGLVLVNTVLFLNHHTF